MLIITGILLLLHLFDGHTEVAHEVIGIGFIAPVAFHIRRNRKGLKIHFRQHVFLPEVMALAALTLWFIYLESKQLSLDALL